MDNYLTAKQPFEYMKDNLRIQKCKKTKGKI